MTADAAGDNGAPRAPGSEHGTTQAESASETIGDTGPAGGNAAAC
jgi:hypothetical protein